MSKELIPVKPDQIREVTTLEYQDYLIGFGMKGGVRTWFRCAYSVLEDKIVDDEALQDIVNTIAGSTNESTAATLVVTTEDNQQRAFRLSVVDSWYGYGYGYGGGSGIIGSI